MTRYDDHPDADDCDEPRCSHCGGPFGPGSEDDRCAECVAPAPVATSGEGEGGLREGAAGMLGLCDGCAEPVAECACADDDDDGDDDDEPHDWQVAEREHSDLDDAYPWDDCHDACGAA